MTKSLRLELHQSCLHGNVAARSEMAEVGDEQELGFAIALARKVPMVWNTIS